MFDIVIPVGPNEIDIIDNVVSNIKKNIIGYNSIFLVSCKNDLIVDGCITISEDIFPFSKETIESIHYKSPRSGWVFQQLLKLYSVITIPNCLDTILVLDADLFILNPLEFIKNDKFLFTVGYEYTINYHIHAEKLHPSIKRYYPQYSGISHHMLFNKFYINSLFKLVEDLHKKPFFNTFIEKMDVSNGLENVQCSEYEIYFNYMCNFHHEKIEIRELRWANVGYYYDNYPDIYDYISIPKYLNTR